MEEKEYKEKYLPAICTKNPIYHLIPYKERLDTLRNIKQECLDIYGYTLDECPKRFECDGVCSGRELPWKAPSAKPFLKKLSETLEMTDGKLFAKACDGCPIRTKCTAVCTQINDYMNRQVQRQPKIYYYKDMERHKEEEKDVFENLKSVTKGLAIPWDALNATRKQVIKFYVEKGRDFNHVAKLTNLYNQAEAKYEFYAGLTTLSKYAILRQFLSTKPKLTDRQRIILSKAYVDNMKVTEIAEEMGISSQAIQQLVDRIVKANNLKWTKFVRKEGSKVIYNTTEIFR